MSKNLIEACLVFFCLLLGVTIGRAACYSDQVSIECSLNADQFAPGDVMQGFLSADNGGAWVMVDVYVAFVMPDGTIYTLTPSSPEGDMAPYISNVSLPPGLVGPVMIFELVVPGGLAPGVYSYMAAIMPSASFELLAMDVMDFEITPPGPVSNVKMIPIPAGSFLMGSPDGEAGRDDDEGPQRTVNTSAFLMAETEVTEKQWEDVMGWNDSHQKLGDDYPVENVTYFDCLSFCNELSKSKGLAECYTLDITDSGGDHIYGADVTSISRRTGIGCRPRLSGSTHAGREQPVGSIQAIRIRTWMRPAGTSATPNCTSARWLRRSRMPSDSMICTETSGSGAGIGLPQITTNQDLILTRTQRGQKAARITFCAAAAGILTQDTAGQPAVTITGRSILSVSSAFASQDGTDDIPASSSERKGRYGEQ